LLTKAASDRSGLRRSWARSVALLFKFLVDLDFQFFPDSKEGKAFLRNIYNVARSRIATLVGTIGATFESAEAANLDPPILP